MSRFHLLAVGLCVVVLGALIGGCASSSESAGADTLTANVGVYPPAPSGAARPRVGVPAFSVTTGRGFRDEAALDALAADQATTLIDATGRFTVIERVQLQKLLDEQRLVGVVKDGELSARGQVRGVDYLLLGKVTNLRMKKEDKSRSFGFAQVGNWLGGADVKKKDVVITVECGVDIRLVNPVSGELMMSSFSEFKRMDKAEAMGVDILGASAEADVDIQITDDDKGKILRLALDDAIRKSLTKIDKFVTSPAAMGASPTPAAPVNGTTAKAFCPGCGKAVTPGAKFCPGCGGKI